MIWVGLFVCLFMLAFAVWLGWGRGSHWREVTGYGQLAPSRGEESFRIQREFEAQGCELRWWGHATVSLDWAGTKLVFDPINAGRVKVTPRRFDDLQLKRDAQFDAIFVTHAHMDHLDLGTLERLASSRLILPAGSERFLNAAVIEQHEVEPIQMGQSVSVGHLTVTPVFAKHGGWRYPWQRGLFACSYVVEHAGQAVYIAGDTALGPHFKTIGQKYHPMVAVLPIGAYSPEWFLRSRHLYPEEALDAAEMLGNPLVLPYHFGTYRLSLDPVGEPLLRFVAEAEKRSTPWYLPAEE